MSNAVATAPQVALITTICGEIAAAGAEHAEVAEGTQAFVAREVAAGRYRVSTFRSTLAVVKGYKRANGIR